MMLMFLKRALLDLKNNPLLHTVTVIVIALSVLIVSTFMLFSFNMAKMITVWESGVRLIVYIKPGIPMAEIETLMDDISHMSGVKNVRFISKQEALAKLAKKMNKQLSLIENLDKNPLPDALEVWINPAMKQWKEIERLAIHIESSHLVDDVEYGKNWLKKFTGILNILRFSAVMMSLIFFLAAVFIVANTIRLVFYSRIEELKIMRLVGATDRFIKMPFYIQGLIQGAAGGLIGIVILYVFFIIMLSSIDIDAVTYSFSIEFIPVKSMIIIIFCSMFAGWLGCYISLRRFLKQ